MATENQTTTLADLINPQVLAGMVSAKIENKLLFAPLAKVDDTLVGVAGNTVTTAKYGYIGDAEEVAEGVKMGTAKLTTSTANFTIKKVGKAVEITDEAVLSGYGNPVDEAASQLAKAIASKIDRDCVEAATKAKLVQDESTHIIDYDGVVNAVDLFNEETQSEKVLFIHSKQLTQIRKNPDFLDKNKYPMELMMTGAVGMIAGCEVVVSNRVKLEKGAYLNPIIKLTEDSETEDETAAITIFLKRDTMVENTRDALAGKNIPSANKHYGVALTNESKVAVVKFAAVTPETPETPAE